MTSVPPKVYPEVSTNFETYRLQIIDNIQKDLIIFLEQDKVLAASQEKKLDRCRQAASWLGSTGTAVSIPGGTVGATDVGIVPGGVLIGVGGILGAGSVIAMKMEERILKTLIKHDKLAFLAESKLFSLRDKISRALKDGKISEEFKDMIEVMRKHALQRSEIMSETERFSRQSKNGASMRSSSTRELPDQLALALKTLKRGSSAPSTSL